GKITYLPDIAEDREMWGPDRAFRPGQLIEAFEHADAVASQAGSNGVAIREMLADRLEPDRAARQEAAGARRVGIVQHALEFVARSSAREQHPGNAALC